MIFTAWPGIRGDTVFNMTFAPENFTSTSAMADFELAASSLLTWLSMEEFDEVVGDGSSGLLALLLILLGLYGLVGCGVLGLIGKFILGLSGGFLGLNGEGVISLGLIGTSCGGSTLGLKTSL